MANLTKNRVLIVAYYFPPLGGGGTLRTLKYVKYLPQLDWQPAVLTVRNAHYLVEDPQLLQQVPNDVVIHRTRAIFPGRFFRRALKHDQAVQAAVAPVKPSRKRRLFANVKNWFYTFVYCPDEYLGWLPFAVGKGWRLLRRGDQGILYTTAPPNSVHLIGLLLKILTGVPWVADFRDLWDQYPDSYNPYRFRWKFNLDRLFEHWVLRHADRVILVSEIMKQQLTAKFPDVPAHKYWVITNGFDPEDFVSVQPAAKRGDVCILLHSGTLFAWRRSTTLFQALRNLYEQSPDFARQFKLQLMGIIHAEVIEEIRQQGLQDKIEIVSYRPYSEMIASLKAADYLLLIIGNQPKAANVLTLKLFDYIGAGRPILAVAPEGEVSRAIRNYHLGKVAAPDDLSAIQEMLQTAYRNWVTGNTNGITANRQSAAAAGTQFNRKNLTRRFIAVMEELYVTP